MGLLKETEERIELRGIKKGIRKGRQEGIEKGIEKVALQMIKDGADIHIICRYTQLTPEQVEALKNSRSSK